MNQNNSVPQLGDFSKSLAQVLKKIPATSDKIELVYKEVEKLREWGHTELIRRWEGPVDVIIALQLGAWGRTCIENIVQNAGADTASPAKVSVDASVLALDVINKLCQMTKYSGQTGHTGPIGEGTPSLHWIVVAKALEEHGASICKVLCGHYESMLINPVHYIVQRLPEEERQKTFAGANIEWAQKEIDIGRLRTLMEGVLSPKNPPGFSNFKTLFNSLIVLGHVSGSLYESDKNGYTHHELTSFEHVAVHQWVKKNIQLFKKLFKDQAELDIRADLVRELRSVEGFTEELNDLFARNLGQEVSFARAVALKKLTHEYNSHHQEASESEVGLLKWQTQSFWAVCGLVSDALRGFGLPENNGSVDRVSIWSLELFFRSIYSAYQEPDKRQAMMKQVESLTTCITKNPLDVPERSLKIIQKGNLLQTTLTAKSADLEVEVYWPIYETQVEMAKVPNLFKLAAGGKQGAIVYITDQDILTGVLKPHEGQRQEQLGAPQIRIKWPGINGEQNVFLADPYVSDQTAVGRCSRWTAAVSVLLHDSPITVVKWLEEEAYFEKGWQHLNAYLSARSYGEKVLAKFEAALLTRNIDLANQCTSTGSEKESGCMNRPGETAGNTPVESGSTRKARPPRV